MTCQGPFGVRDMLCEGAWLRLGHAQKATKEYKRDRIPEDSQQLCARVFFSLRPNCMRSQSPHFLLAAVRGVDF